MPPLRYSRSFLSPLTPNRRRDSWTLLTYYGRNCKCFMSAESVIIQLVSTRRLTDYAFKIKTDDYTHYRATTHES